jgi:hypothetical protein
MSIVTSRVLGPCITSCWQPNRRAGISLCTFGMDFVASGFVRIPRAAGPPVIAACVQQNNCVSLFSWRKHVLFGSETPPMPPAYSHEPAELLTGDIVRPGRIAVRLRHSPRVDHLRSDRVTHQAGNERICKRLMRLTISSSPTASPWVSFREQTWSISR